MKYDEKFNCILQEMPAPPLFKLYGNISGSITGRKCTKLTSIQKGAEIRNSLVHSPSEQKLSIPQVNQYIYDVETSIFELYQNNIFLELFSFKISHVPCSSNHFSYILISLRKLCNRTFSFLVLSDCLDIWIF